MIFWNERKTFPTQTSFSVLSLAIFSQTTFSFFVFFLHIFSLFLLHQLVPFLGHPDWGSGNQLFHWFNINCNCTWMTMNRTSQTVVAYQRPPKVLITKLLRSQRDTCFHFVASSIVFICSTLSSINLSSPLYSTLLVPLLQLRFHFRPHFPWTIRYILYILSPGCFHILFQFQNLERINNNEQFFLTYFELDEECLLFYESPRPWSSQFHCNILQIHY